MRQVRNCLLSPTTITSLTKGISFLILISMGTGWMLSPLDKIISSGGERGPDEKEIEKQWKESGGRRVEKREERECTTLTLLPASNVQKVILYRSG